MNDQTLPACQWLAIYIIHSNDGEAFLQPVMLAAINEHLAERAAILMGRYRWPDYGETYNDWYWSFERAGLELSQLRALDDTAAAVIAELAFTDCWKISESEDGQLVITEQGSDHIWQPAS
ncbi:hypothetical protein BL250_00665 [Erwinia sp. OLTSP20]|nr:hypothetical protein BV501_00805 [Erwinia sp. OAMSP11]PIJ73153.1 hypothetical protein BK416_07825 [Erwinia sp. OLSSP12]PIJ84662.1 hypothetical protein BLD47_01625 [Erwinia sp. OLCASP19]PIJ87309.1 hypothetical protein BLD46_00770 [Erwinia sp. OLMTSP26]PIJ87536.1 hypothetical protein BLD49_05905 [Erwinia sp. OLMDSP33]PIJ93890.1 hypothetical protein BL249_03565 [Erwinia sp. OLFS4]PIJ95420.1 hypothetical protein BL250_00665 [Erwinia sp. OLTSP20]